MDSPLAVSFQCMTKSTTKKKKKEMDSCDLANILLCETNHTIFVNKDENSKLTRSYQKSIQHK